MNNEIDNINQTIAGYGAQWVNLRNKTDRILEGTIMSVEQRQKTFEGAAILSRKTQQPRMEWVFVLQTDKTDGDDDGIRKFAANESAQRAIATALNEAHQKLAIGGHLKIAVTENPPSDRDQARYKAKYEPPTTPAVNADDIFANDEEPF